MPKSGRYNPKLGLAWSSVAVGLCQALSQQAGDHVWIVRSLHVPCAEMSTKRSPQLQPRRT